MTDYRIILKNKREALHITQYRMAKDLGIKSGFLNEVEACKKNTSVPMLLRMCEYLEIRLFPEE